MGNTLERATAACLLWQVGEKVDLLLGTWYSSIVSLGNAVVAFFVALVSCEGRWKTDSRHYTRCNPGE
jgi:hypothetical protein